MAVNIFKGARRFSKLVAALWALFFCVNLWITESRIPLVYVVTWADSVPVRMKDGERCLRNDADEWKTIKTTKGTNISLTLCFRHFKSKNYDVEGALRAGISKQDILRFLQENRLYDVEGARKVGISDDEMLAVVNEGIDASLIEQAKSKVIKEFRLPKVDEEWVDSQWWSGRRQDLENALILLVGGWVFIGATTWVVGWIMRGFLGIPLGQDRRVEKD